MGLPAIERKNVLDLFPYFSKQPIVFDVGSNKGEWSDNILDHVHWIWLFEPNTDLLTYTKVKYCDRENVYYCGKAVFSKTSYFPEVGIVFNYFTNQNNGLSSVYNNPKWDHLPKQQRHVQCVTIDDFCKEKEIPYIDFVKIDVEGADYDVLVGAKKLLKKKLIRFIQVEKSEHLHLAGHTFEELEAYLKSFGYAPIPNEDTENVIFAMEGFTQDWNTMFKMNTEGMKVNFALEIGCFEGLTSRYICDNLLNPNGRVICVDPLTDQYLDQHADNHIFVGQYERFTRNTKNYPIELIRKKSQDAFEQLKDYRFDLIYVDGDHREEAVYMDGVNAFRICQEHGGHILFDDYMGYSEETTRGIHRFLETQKGNYEIVKSNYQLLIKRLR